MKQSDIYDIYNRKAPGCDGIPIEFLKAGGDEAIRVMTSLCNSIWKTKIWPNDWKKSIYVPLYNNRFNITCKPLLRILQKRLETFLIPELPIEQAEFRRCRVQ